MLLATLAAGHGYAQRGGEPGRFDYYVLVLGWTPSYCATEGKKRRDRECAGGGLGGGHGWWKNDFLCCQQLFDFRVALDQLAMQLPHRECMAGLLSGFELCLQTC